MRTLIAYDSFFGNTEIDTTYTLRLRLALRDTAPYGRNVVYAKNVKRKYIKSDYYEE